MLEAKIQETKATLVIIDALADVMPGADENTVKDVQPLLMNLRGIADRNQCAIIIIHHSNRAGNYRGSSALLGAVDLTLKMESKPESPNIDFKVEKNRDDEPKNFSAVAHFEGDKFYLTPSISQNKSTFSGAKLYVLQCFHEKPSFTMKDIETQRGSFSKDALRGAVNDLKTSGHVKRIDDGGPGKIATYALTDKGKEAVENKENL